MRFLIGLVGAGEHVHGVGLDPRNGGINLAQGHGLVDGTFWRKIAVGRPGMAIHAIHGAHFHPGDIIGEVLGFEDRYMALRIRNAHPRDFLPLPVGGDVLDLIARDIVPVDAADGPLADIATANLEQQADGVGGIGGVALEIIESAVEIADERFQP